MPELQEIDFSITREFHDDSEKYNRWLLDNLDFVADLGQKFQSDFVKPQDPISYIQVTKPVLKRLVDFETVAFLFFNEEEMDFTIADCEPVDHKQQVEKLVDVLIDDGTFAWALYQNRPVFITSKTTKTKTMLRVLATKKRVVGMFIGILKSPDQFIPDTVLKLISIILLNCTSHMESSTLYNKLNSYVGKLKQTNKTLRREISVRKQTECQLQDTNKSLVEANSRTSRIMVELEETLTELRIAKDAAEESDRLKSAFLTTTSHELRTPLNAIIGFLQLVTDGICDTPEEEHKYLANSIKSSFHLLQLIDDILDMSKLETGEIRIDSGNVNLIEIFNQVNHFIREQAQQKNLKIIFRTENEHALMVRADYHKLKQALINLVSNAIKFTAQGNIMVTADAASIEGFVQITVSDTGVGVSLKQQKNVFNKFTQADGSTSRPYGGAGLGLSITKGLVEMMGGSIELTSPGEGQGTTVTFTIPSACEDFATLEQKDIS